MVDYEVVRDRDEKEDKVAGEIVLLMRTYQELDKEIGEKDDTYPELYFHELSLAVEGFVMKCVD